METSDLYALYLKNPSVETDTRKLKRGDIFFALKGPRFNGNDYTQKALELGASWCVVDEDKDVNCSDKIIKVHDTLIALQQLAKFHREQFNIPFIAITGSNGKTTTKELIHAVLSITNKVYTTNGNMNNHIGVPLTLLKIKHDAAFAVIEMGANHIKEIEGYCEYTMPTHGLITNCGKAHLEGFGSEEGVKIAKGELYNYLKNNHGKAWVNWDYDYLREMSKGIPNIIKYGTGNDEEDFGGYALEEENFIKVMITKGLPEPEIKTQLIGEYNLFNILAAIAVGRTFNISSENIKAALAGYVPSNSRSQLVVMESNKIVLDAYNANPSSMKAAIENFAKMAGSKKIIILGSMAELGKDSIAEHKTIIELIRKHNWFKVVLVGNDFKDTLHNFIQFNDTGETQDWFREQAFSDTQVLIKGSRSMQMEKVIE